jgi:hypothetical protein
VPALASALAVLIRVVPARVLWPKVDDTAERSRDKVGQFIDWLLGCLQTIWNAPLYAVPAWLARQLNRDKPWIYFNHVYAAFWLLVIGLGAGLAAPQAEGTWQLVLLGVVFWRGVEILRGISSSCSTRDTAYCSRSSATSFS